MITNLRYADDIILLATTEAELQQLVDRLNPVNRKYSLKGKGKGFPYSTPSVGPGADPGVRQSARR